LTLDPWLNHARNLQKKVLAEAGSMAERDDHIMPEDCKPITFANISDLERTLVSTSESSFLDTLAASKEDRFFGFELSSVRDETEPEKIDTKTYPFDLSQLLPWWGMEPADLVGTK